MKTNRIVSSVVVSLTLAVGVTTGCAIKTSSTTTPSSADPVDQSSDALSTESDTEAFGSTLGGGSGTGGLAPSSLSDLVGNGSAQLTADDVKIGDVAKAFYLPAGCLTVTDDAATKSATYVFANCTGPYGLVHVTGTVTVGYASSGLTQLTLTFAAKGFEINKSTIDWSATANITASAGGVREMAWNGMISGTTGRGRAFTRTNQKDYKWTVGMPCLTVTGESDGTVTGHELKTDIINFTRCKNACPESGSEIKVTDETDGKVYDVKWAATDATYTGPAGNSVTFVPACAD